MFLLNLARAFGFLVAGLDRDDEQVRHSSRRVALPAGGGCRASSLVVYVSLGASLPSMATNALVLWSYAAVAAVELAVLGGVSVAPHLQLLLLATLTVFLGAHLFVAQTKGEPSAGTISHKDAAQMPLLAGAALVVLCAYLAAAFSARRRGAAGGLPARPPSSPSARSRTRARESLRRWACVQPTWR